LTAKYAELVVDEAQDCSAADLYILNRGHDLGLPLIIVADPDQAIYDFRGAATQELIRLAGQLGRHELTYNWLRRPGRQPGFPFLRRLGPRRSGGVAVTMFGLVGLGMLTCAMGLFWKSASWTAPRAN
jgi:hypothetical protein